MFPPWNQTWSYRATERSSADYAIHRQEDETGTWYTVYRLRHDGFDTMKCMRLRDQTMALRVIDWLVQNDVAVLGALRRVREDLKKDLVLKAEGKPTLKDGLNQLMAILTYSKEQARRPILIVSHILEPVPGTAWLEC